MLPIFQARRYFTVRTVTDTALMLWVASPVRAKLPIPAWVFPVVVTGGLASMGVKFTYDDQIRRFWDEIRQDWQAHERVLAHDPRNGHTR